ncbi:SapB/AmfS family lanthipeptide [Luethyella okanaganae]|uniref:SapB/AmfS family lanthipeptide n=1 Tax=Luethyella okanaganae TaxID=69372 RepID=A0ABW1VDA3_9MICO
MSYILRLQTIKAGASGASGARTFSTLSPVVCVSTASVALC